MICFKRPRQYKLYIRRLEIEEMANNSAKQNEKNIKNSVIYVQIVIFGLILWFMGFNSLALISQKITIWSYLSCLAISILSYGCYKQLLKCWELQLPPEASQYYIDLLAINCLVHLLDPFTSKVWHLYWLIVAYIAWQGLKWLWDYITPKYEEQEGDDENEQGSKKKEKKEKKQKVKYIK